MVFEIILFPPSMSLHDTVELPYRICFILQGHCTILQNFLTESASSFKVTARYCRTSLQNLLHPSRSLHDNADLPYIICFILQGHCTILQNFLTKSALSFKVTARYCRTSLQNLLYPSRSLHDTVEIPYRICFILQGHCRILQNFLTKSALSFKVTARYSRISLQNLLYPSRSLHDIPELPYIICFISSPL
jgi:hypothetical protein